MTGKTLRPVNLKADWYERQITRLKLIKRQSCGRAALDLLRRRGLLAA
ncbi:MAG: hypothetical protein M3Y41_13735 [Pseudomonadota bacterium]|nr:hypothetical protein [Pseudomonadota bacterium]